MHNNGHFATAKVEEVIRRDNFIPGLHEKIKKHVFCCVPCIGKHRKIEGYLDPISKGEIPLEIPHVDHLGPIEMTTKMYKYEDNEC